MKKGFTLIEVMISVMIFSVVMVVALGALLSMSQSDQRAEALKSIINNLDFALDSMTRTIRTGYYYHCGTSGTDLATPAPQDCDGKNSTPSSGTYLALATAQGAIGAGDTPIPNANIAYCINNGAIVRDVVAANTTLDTNCSSTNFYALTSKEIVVNSLKFIVTGSCPKNTTGLTCTGDSIQPKVTILVSGSININGTASSTFNLETSVTQRIYDQ